MKSLMITLACLAFVLVPQLPAQEKKNPEPASGAGPKRLGTLDTCWAKARNAWGSTLRQIPSTVVDKGVLRYIPYTSYHSNRYEVNVYGDPDRPCCIEAGIFNGTLETPTAKRTCIELMEALLQVPEDREVLRSLNLEKSLKMRAGLTFEVTPSTAEDAYGGWWVSVYDEAACDKVRATPDELKAITIPKKTILEQATAKRPNGKDKTSDEGSSDWTADDLKLARPSASDPKTDPIGSTSGTVYVHGYVRKDGTYVRPYIRSSPRR